MPGAPTALVGQRERNKIDKLRRIKDAARELFLTKGYDEATTREIALRAGVGLGTVFIYAENKRDLLFLVANDELEETTRRAEQGVRAGASCLQNLLTVFRHHYEFFAEQPALSRPMLREMVFYDTGHQAKRFHATRDRIIALIADIVKSALDRRTIRAQEDHHFIGWLIFCLYQVEIRRWLSANTLDLDEGLDTLRRALILFMRGLSPTADALRIG